MTVEQSLNWCAGCADPNTRAELPRDWKEGDPIPNDVTVHGTAREGYSFVFRDIGQGMTNRERVKI